MRKFLVLALLASLSSVGNAADLFGIDADSVGFVGIDSTLGNRGDSTFSAANRADTTNFYYVGEYKWIRVWATGTCDTCTVIAQKAWDVDSTWTFKDSTATAESTLAFRVLYDSLYIPGGVNRSPTVPAPYMRWILVSREQGLQSIYSQVKNFTIHLVGGN